MLSGNIIRIFLIINLNKNMIFYFIFPVIYLLIFAFSEILYRRGLDGKITRKIDHIGGGITSLFLPSLTSVSFVIFLGIAIMILLALFQKRKWLKSLNNKKHIEFGAVAFPLSIALSSILWYNNIRNAFYISVLVMSLADSAGCLFGYFWGNRYKIKKFNKTLLGSLSFYMVTVLVLSFFILPSEPVAIFLIILGGFMLTITELVTPFGLDNLTVPIIAGYIYIFIRYLI